MTWKEFKDNVEEMGITDNDSIEYIEISGDNFGVVFDKVKKNYIIEDLD